MPTFRITSEAPRIGRRHGAARKFSEYPTISLMTGNDRWRDNPGGRLWPSKHEDRRCIICRVRTKVTVVSLRDTPRGAAQRSG